MEGLLQDTTLIQRAYWLVRLRWVAIGTLGVATFVTSRILKVALPVHALYIMTAALLAYNFVLYDYLRYCTWGGREPSPKTIGGIVTFQISADLFILTTILHFSGGIENPFSFFFVFHMILASILRPRLQSYLQATLAVLLFTGLLVLEAGGVLPHYDLVGFAGHGLYRNPVFLFGVLFAFATTVYLVVYMTTSITEQLRKQHASFENANRLLQQNDRLKNEYVLRVTHDVKGHLAAIAGCLNIVADGIVGPLNEKQRDLVDRACRRTSKCMAFVTALLKVTRMKLTGRLETAEFSLKNTVFDALAAVQARAKDRSIEVGFEIAPSVDAVWGEAVLIEETITNMLINAVKYTPPGGNVRITVKDQGDSVLVQISDTGIGIPTGEVNRIFEEFYRASNARAVEREGTGLGLAFAKQVVERHGGRIWVENRAEGGSIFSFTLPKQPSAHT